MKLMDRIWAKLFGPKPEDSNVEFKGPQGRISLERKQYPYIIDDPQQSIIDEQIEIKQLREIEELGGMPHWKIVVLMDGDGISYDVEGLTLEEIINKLKGGCSPIPF